MSIREFVSKFNIVTDPEDEDYNLTPHCRIHNDEDNYIPETELFSGRMRDIPSELLDKNFDKWDVLGGSFIFIVLN